MYRTNASPATRQASNTHTCAPQDHHNVPDVPGTWHEDSDDEQLYQMWMEGLRRRGEVIGGVADGVDRYLQRW